MILLIVFGLALIIFGLSGLQVSNSRIGREVPGLDCFAAGLGGVAIVSGIMLVLAGFGGTC